MKDLVDKFLSWPLPRTVCADTCATTTDYPHPRIGTNLLNAAEAEEMLNHVVGEVLKERDALRADLATQKAANETLLFGPTVAELRAALKKAKENLLDCYCHELSPNDKCPRCEVDAALK